MTQAFLLNHLWQSTLFAVVPALLILALKGNRAPVRYWLWFAASVKFLIPFSLLVAIGSHFEWRTAPQPSASPAVSAVPRVSMIGDISQPFTPAAPVPGSRAPVLLGLWVCGMLVVGFAWFRQWLRVRAAMRAAAPLHLNLPIKALPILARSSSARLEPGVFGIFRPVLLLPEGITERLTPAQMDAILAHELCHVRRRDNLTAAIHMAVEAIFWFHPLVWWIGKRLVDECERACDEEVLLAAGDPAEYAEGILNVCKLYVESPLRCVSGVTGSNLKKRIRAIMTERVSGDLSLAKKLALAVAGLAGSRAACRRRCGKGASAPGSIAACPWRTGCGSASQAVAADLGSESAPTRSGTRSSSADCAYQAAKIEVIWLADVVGPDPGRFRDVSQLGRTIFSTSLCSETRISQNSTASARME
jgi:bla regulator protein blaR1